MKFNIGVEDYAFRQKNERIPVTWDSRDVVNHHILIAGKSGTGKTHTLRRMINDCLSDGSKVRFHIMDVHGDIDIEGASSILFSEASQYGLNPLKINSDPHFGGIRRRIQSFLSTLNRTQSRVLGPKQEAVLRNIVIDLYAANGFYHDKPQSWVLEDGISRRFPKKYPNIEDAHRFAYAKLKQMFIGSDTTTIKHLEDVNRKTSLLQSKLKKANNVSADGDKEKLEKEINNVSDQAIEAFTKYITNIKTGQEIDSLLKYDSMDVLKSVVDRLENMKATGLFKNQPISFDESKSVWRYDLRALNEEEKRMFVEFCLQDLFAQAVQRGPVDDVLDIIILDEAHLFFKDDDENILNSLAKEARKFGIGLVCASQSPTHFSDDFLANVATKIILGIDQMYWDGTARKMKIDIKLFNFIVARRTIATQINKKNNGNSSFKQVYIGD